MQILEIRSDEVTTKSVSTFPKIYSPWQTVSDKVWSCRDWLWAQEKGNMLDSEDDAGLGGFASDWFIYFLYSKIVLANVMNK